MLNWRKIKTKHQTWGVVATWVFRKKCTALDAIHQERRKVTNQWFKLQPEASSKRRAKRTHIKEIRGRIKTNEIKYEKKPKKSIHPKAILKRSIKFMI